MLARPVTINNVAAAYISSILSLFRGLGALIRISLSQLLLVTKLNGLSGRADSRCSSLLGGKATLAPRLGDDDER